MHPFLCTSKYISIHALLAESDVVMEATKVENQYFYPRSPCGERREYWIGGYGTAYNFYPRSPCGERRFHYDNYNLHCVISIHALLAESDLMTPSMGAIRILFLSTLSLRRATTWARGSRVTYVISIHALLAESDADRDADWVRVYVFLSTLSLRRATNGHETTLYKVGISIHALLAESDERPVESRSNIFISIHALLAESDLMTPSMGAIRILFLSTLSLRRAT